MVVNDKTVRACWADDAVAAAAVVAAAVDEKENSRVNSASVEVRKDEDVTAGPYARAPRPELPLAGRPARRIDPGGTTAYSIV